MTAASHRDDSYAPMASSIPACPLLAGFANRLRRVAQCLFLASVSRVHLDGTSLRASAVTGCASGTTTFGAARRFCESRCWWTRSRLWMVSLEFFVRLALFVVCGSSSALRSGGGRRARRVVVDSGGSSSSRRRSSSGRNVSISALSSGGSWLVG